MQNPFQVLLSEYSENYLRKFEGKSQLPDLSHK